MVQVRNGSGKGCPNYSSELNPHCCSHDISFSPTLSTDPPPPYHDYHHLHRRRDLQYARPRPPYGWYSEWVSQPPAPLRRTAYEPLLECRHKPNIALEELKAIGAIPGYAWKSISFPNSEMKEPYFLKVRFGEVDR